MERNNYEGFSPYKLPEDFTKLIEDTQNLNDREESLLKEFYLKIFFGDPELAIYNISSFLEIAGNNAKELQKKYTRMLSPEQTKKLVERIPKGAVGEFEVERCRDGSSPARLRRARRLLERSKSVYVIETSESLPEGLKMGGNVVSEVQLNSLSLEFHCLSQDEVRIISSLLSDEGKHVLNIVGTVQSEPIQGFGGIRLLSNGLDVGEEPGDVIGFVLTGVDREVAQRRPREIYLGRSVKVLVSNNTWQPGIIEGRTFPDKLLVQLISPFLERTSLNIGRVVKRVCVWIGVPPDYEYANDLPTLGLSSFEIEPWLYENIKLGDEEPFTVETPEALRSGKLVQFSNGEIYEVARVSSQGFAEVRRIDRPSSLDWETVNWIEFVDLPQLLTSEGLDLAVVEEVKEIIGARLKVNTKFLGSNEEKDVIVMIEGVYNINNEPVVMLKALPVFLGKGGNIPDFNHKAIRWIDFIRLRERNVFDISSPDVTSELREKFPLRFDDILNCMDDTSGVVLCFLELEDGRTDNGPINIFSLPYGIWNVWQPGGIPELIPLSQIKDIVPYSR